jgi:AcrR family transcriptional regulator
MDPLSGETRNRYDFLMTAAGRRERNKQRVRGAIAQAALRRFSAHGFEATTIAAICEEADVAVSTFYAYFDSKEAAAFPDADARAHAAERILAERPAGEPVHATLRRAAHAIVEHDLGAPDAVGSRAELLAREPRLAAHARRLESAYVERLGAALARQIGVDPSSDLRPRLAVAALFGALNAAWSVWTQDGSTDLHALVDEAHDLLDDGLARL